MAKEALDADLTALLNAPIDQPAHEGAADDAAVTTLDTKAPNLGAQPAKDEAEVTVIDHSPSDDKRRSIFKNFRRTDSEEFDAKDLPDLAAGRMPSITPKPAAPVEPSQDDALDELDVDAAQTQQQVKAKTPATQQPRTHGNKNVQLVVNRQVIELPMRDVRQLLVEQGVDDVDSLPEAVQIASARTLLAAKQRLAEAKAPRQEQQATPQQTPPPAATAEAPDEFVDLVNELQFGDQEAAATKLRSLVTRQARDQAAEVSNVSRQQQVHSQAMRAVEEVANEYAQRPEFAPIANDPVTFAVLKTATEIGIAHALSGVMAPEDFQQLKSPDERARVYWQLRNQGARLPSEGQLARFAHETALRRLGGTRSQTQTTEPSAVAVQVSPERLARRSQAAPQPRASSATAPAADPPKTRSAVVQGMRRARGQPVA